MDTLKKSNFYYNLELNGRPDRYGNYNILLRVSAKGSSSRFKLSTNIHVKKNHFNSKAKSGKWVTKDFSSREINNRLADFISDTKRTVETIIDEGKATTLQSIKDSITGKAQFDSTSFITYFEHKLEQAKVLNSVNYSRGLETKLKKLKTYLKGRDLAFSELTPEFLTKYKIHLTNLGNNKNTIISNFKDIRSVFYKAYKEQFYTGHNPFTVFEVGTMKARKRRLSSTELKRLKEFHLEPNSSLWHARNYFLFSFYCAGIRVSDLIRLKWGDIKEGRVTYGMSKNESEHSIKLTTQALEILAHYEQENRQPTDYVFPILHEGFDHLDKFKKNKILDSKKEIIRNNLKKIQNKAGIETSFSMHVSRHSYANLLRENKVDTHQIKDLLNHSSIAVTEAYLAQFNRTTADEVHEDILSSI